MPRNVCSKFELIIRLVVAIDLFALFLLLPEPADQLGWLGVIPLATAILRYCPLSHLLGRTTCSASAGRL